MRWIWTYLRTSGSNFHEVVPGRIYRSAAPEASDLVKLRAKFGIDTLLDLRQASDVGTDRRTPSEKLREYQRLLAECKRLGIKHVSVPFDDKAMPLRLQIDKHLRCSTIRRIALFNCSVMAAVTGVVGSSHVIASSTRAGRRKRHTTRRRSAGSIPRWGMGRGKTSSSAISTALKRQRSKCKLRYNHKV